MSIGEDAGVLRVWLALNGVDFVPRIQWSIAVANTGTLTEQPEVIAAVLRGCRRSYRYVAVHQDEWAAFGAQYFCIPRRIMTSSIAREIDGLHFDCEVDAEGLEAAIALQQKLGALPNRLRLADIIDFRFQGSLPHQQPHERSCLPMGGQSLGEREALRRGTN